MRLSYCPALTLFALTSCAMPEDDSGAPLDEADLATAGDFDLDDDNYPEDPLEYTMDWDDPTFMPEIDRFAPENMLLIDVPLGTSVITAVDEWSIKGQSGGDRLGISTAAGSYFGSGADDLMFGSIYAAGRGGGRGAGCLGNAEVQGRP